MSTLGSPLPAGERSDRIARCDPGEGEFLATRVGSWKRRSGSEAFLLVIASKAKRPRTVTHWIASSLALLAMTDDRSSFRGASKMRTRNPLDRMPWGGMDSGLARFTHAPE